MRFRSWFFLILGLVLAGLTGIALNGVAQQNAARAAVTPVVETISVLVAKTDIAARTVIIADLLETRTYPKEILPDGAIGKAADARAGPRGLAGARPDERATAAADRARLHGRPPDRARPQVPTRQSGHDRRGAPFAGRDARRDDDECRRQLSDREVRDPPMIE